MIFTPADPLELETAYVLTVGEGISDPSGNRMTELPPPFEFVTAGRPTLVESDPADGADEVPLAGPIGLTFSTLMDTASVEGQLRLVPAFDHELRWSGELLEIVPTEPLDPGRDYAGRDRRRCRGRRRRHAGRADPRGVHDGRPWPGGRDARPRRRRRWRGDDLADRGRLRSAHRPRLGRRRPADDHARGGRHARGGGALRRPARRDRGRQPAALHPIEPAAGEHDVRGRARRGADDAERRHDGRAAAVDLHDRRADRGDHERDHVRHRSGRGRERVGDERRRHRPAPAQRRARAGARLRDRPRRQLARRVGRPDA